MALPTWLWVVIAVLIVLLVIWFLGLVTPAVFWIIVVVLIILALLYLVFNRNKTTVTI